jgi:hypothetical protein
MTKAIPQSNQATFGALANGVTLMQANFSDHAFERHSHDCPIWPPWRACRACI